MLFGVWCGGFVYFGVWLFWVCLVVVWVMFGLFVFGSFDLFD